MRILAIAAALWAIGYTVYVIATPAAMSATQPASNGSPAVVQSISWYEFAGFYGTVLLLLWASLIMLGAWAAWTSRIVLLALIAIPTLVFNWLTLLSIGGGYLPASLALLAALILGGLQERRKRKRAQ